MALRALAICAVVICLVGCDTDEPLASVQHRGVWQRQAGKSPRDAITVARQFDKNTAELKEALAGDSSAESLNRKMRGKLVQIDGQVIDQNDSNWTLKTPEGWTIIAPISDLTAHADTSMDRVEVCTALGSISTIDLSQRKIILSDVELALQMKPPMSETVVTK